MFNSTMFIRKNDVDYNTDTFPLSYEEDEFDSSSIILNRTYYEDFLSSNINTTTTTSSSILSFSSPFTYMIFIIISYLILTLILLTFSLYKQRQNEIENFYFGDTDEEIEQTKRQLRWKRLLIGKIQKGDMKPLLTDRTDQQINTGTFPLYVV